MSGELNVRELKKELAARGLNTDGKKEELLQRLLRNVMDGAQDETRCEDVRINTRHIPSKSTQNMEQKEQEDRYQARYDNMRFTIRDVIDILPSFDPTDESGLSSEQWVQQVEALMDTHQIDARLVILASKDKMKAYANKWYKTVGCGVTWKEFKSELQLNFQSCKNQAEIHEILRKRIRKRDQGLIEYFYDICAVAKNYIGDESTIYYIIQGMNEFKLSCTLKTVRINSLDQLKDHIEWYVKMNRETERKNCEVSVVKNPDKAEKINIKSDDKSVREMRRQQCYNCFQNGHIASKCPLPLRKPICERCKKIGHKKDECKVKLSSNEENKTVYQISNAAEVQGNQDMSEYNEIEVDEMSQVAVKVIMDNRLINTKVLIDSGSTVSIVRENLIKEYNYNFVSENMPNITGINESSLVVLGEIGTNVIISDKLYKVNLLVVPNETMDMNIILGRDFLSINRILTVRIKPSSAFDLNLMREVSALDEQVMLIEARDEVSVGDTEETLKFRNEVSSLFDEYYIKGESKGNEAVRYEAEIKLKEKKVVRVRPKRFSHYERVELKKITDELMRTGIIRHSESAYTSRVVLVRKKNGTLRMCVDYRQLNKIVERICYPMPIIEDVLVRLSGKKYFSSLDLRNGFYHVDLKEESKQYTSFVTEEGQFEFNKLPFGYTNSPAHFVKYIQMVFKDLTDNNKILIFIDDILVSTESIEEHLDILRELFRILAENNIKLQVAKCSFLKTEIEYLGYSIRQSQITLSNKHIETISQYPVPTDNKSLQQFVGLVSYFRKFIENFSRIASPLYELLKVREFEFQKKHWDSFNKLKELLINRPVLALYNIQNETQLHTDASSSGFGAVLLQRQKDKELHPIMYFSKKTTDVEARLHSFELETLAVVYAIKRFRPYLFGIHFTIITDCNALRLTLAKRDLNSKIDRWALFLEEYNFEVIHRCGERMRHVDALSRIQIYYLEVNEKDLFLEKIYICQLEDKIIQKIKVQVENGKLKGYELREGIVYRKDKDKLQLLIPEKMIDSVIYKYHDKMGHLGCDKVSEMIRRQFYFADMKQKLVKHAESCIVCIAYNPKPIKKEALLKSIEKGKEPFQTVHLDHLGPLEYNKQYYDKGVRKKVSYQEGDLVMVRETSQVGQNNKLRRKFKGPYRVSKVLDQNRYVLKDIEGYQVSARPFGGIFDSRSMRLYSKNVGQGEKVENECDIEILSGDTTYDQEFRDEEYLDEEYEIEYLNSEEEI